MKSNDNIGKWTTSRYYTYAFFADIFLKEPTLDSYLNNQLIIDKLLPDLSETNDTEPIPKEQISETKLRQEYYDCFFVPISGKYVPPYESALRGYRKNKEKSTFGKLNTEITAQVKKQYDFVGFDPLILDVFPPLKNIQLADHIGYELAFMAFLCRCEKEVRKINQQEKANMWIKFQEEFIAKHFLKWIPQLTTALKEIGKNIFETTALVLDNWVNTDYEDLIRYKNIGGIYIEH